TLTWFRSILKNYADEISAFASVRTLFMGLVNEDSQLEMYDGLIRIMDRERHLMVDGLKPENYAQFIGEAVEEHSYLKSPFYKPLGYPDGIYRVGPLARLNIVSA